MKRILSLLLAAMMLLSMPFAAFAAEGGFTDVSKKHWAYEAIMWAQEEGLMTGTGNGAFSPNGVVSRAQLVTVLWRMEGEPAPTKANPFKDLTQSWYKKAVIWANEAGVVKGTGDGTTFTPNGTLTRETAATMFRRYSEYKGYDISDSADLSSFADGKKVSKWAKDGLAWANAEGLITGVKENGVLYLKPQGEAGRAQLATILQRYDTNIVEEPAEKPQPQPKPEPKPDPDCPHTFDNECDAVCDSCGAKRTPSPHLYLNNCDPDCEYCGAKRTPADHVYSYPCDDICDSCGIVRVAAPHVYDNACDKECNLCGQWRQASACVFKGACGTICTVCGAKGNDWGNHTYDNRCDAICNVCGESRTVDPHVFSDHADATCNYCGYVRPLTQPDHVFDNPCDTTCNLCDYRRTVPHVFSNACDADCNLCGEPREPSDHQYDNACDFVCNVCGYERMHQPHHYKDPCTHYCTFCGAYREEAHRYSSDCDAICNYCEEERTASGAHVYRNNCDPDCDDCGHIRTNLIHTFSYDCDATCNHCSFTRAATHIYSYPCDHDCNICFQWRQGAPCTFDNACDTECNVCGSPRSFNGHVYDAICDDTCNECGYVRVAFPHQYENDCDTDCNYCGLTRTVFHTYSNSFDPSCNVCGAVREVNVTPEYGTHPSIPTTQRYYYNTLTPSQQAIYMEIHEAVQNREHQIYIGTNASSLAGLLLNAYKSDHPECFYVSGSYGIRTVGGTETYLLLSYTDGVVSSDFRDAPPAYVLSAIGRKQERLEAAVAEILATIPTNILPAEKEKMIYDYLQENACYHRDAVNNPSDYDSSIHDSWTLCGVLLNGTGVCESYAESFQYLCLSVGINATTISGYAGGAHKWAAVELEGEWYFCDPTFDDPIYIDGAGNVLDVYIPSYEYFNRTTAEMTSHEATQTDAPICTGTKYSYENYFQV